MFLIWANVSYRAGLTRGLQMRSSIGFGVCRGGLALVASVFWAAWFAAVAGFLHRMLGRDGRIAFPRICVQI